MQDRPSLVRYLTTLLPIASPSVTVKLNITPTRLETAHKVVCVHLKSCLQWLILKSYIVTPSVYPSNLPIDRGLASADDDSYLKDQSTNIGTTNADISTTVPTDAKISPAFSAVDNAEMAVAGMISLVFLLMKLISILN